MANKSDFLSLILPGNDEYTDQWDVPVNENFTKIDAWASEIQSEVEGARGQQGTIGAFLGVDHNPDGTNKPSAEVFAARNSKVYGDTTPAAVDSKLSDHFEYLDMEVHAARAMGGSLEEGLSIIASGFAAKNRVIKGASTSEGLPNFLTAAGTDFQITASDSVPVVCNINGHMRRVRKNTSVTASGSAGLRYLVATVPATPVVTLDRSTQSNGALTTNPSNNDKLQILQDATVNFTLLDVRAGDQIELLNSNSQGKYLIAEVAPGGNVNQIVIKGIFPATGSGINYKIYDLLAVELAAETAYPTVDTKCPVGQATWDGVALSSAAAYAFKGHYESSWVAVDTTSGGGYYNLTFDHNLGFIPKRLTILASQVNDDTSFVEELSTCEVDNQLTVSITNGLNFTPPSLTYTDVDVPADTVVFSPGGLTGNVTGSMSGSIRNSRSSRAKMSKTQIVLKNPTQSLFYIDFDGNVRQAGFIKVIVE